MFRKRSDLDLERLNSGTSEKLSKSKSQNIKGEYKRVKCSPHWSNNLVGWDMLTMKSLQPSHNSTATVTKY